MSTLFFAPIDGATLSGQVSLRLLTRNDTGTFSDYSLTLGGMALDAPVLLGGYFRLVVDSRRYANGAGVVLRADATHSVDGAVFEELAVTLDNTEQTNFEYHIVSTVNGRGGQQINSVDLGLKTFALPASNRLRYWTQARLLADTTPGLPDMDTLDTSDLDAMAALWALGQVVTLENGAFSSALRSREEFQWRYDSGAALDVPGQVAYLMLRLVPVEAQAWYETGLEAVVAIKRSDAFTETWHVLARNLDASAAALWEYKVTGDLESPVVTWTQKIDFTTLAPEAKDFCVVGSKVYVVRDGILRLRVFDLDSGDAILDLGVVDEARLPLAIENCDGVPLMVVVDAGLGSNRSKGYDLTFDRPRPAWTITEAVTHIKWAFSTTGILGIAAGTKIYTSLAATGAPTLNHTFANNISALGVTAADGVSLKTYVGLTTGALYMASGTDWVLQATLGSVVTAAAAWPSDGESEHGVAGNATDVLTEQGLDGDWGAGATLVPPDADTLTGVVALEGFERVVTPSSGQIGDIDFVAAVTDYRLLIGTTDSGLFGTLQRSTLTPADGAFLSYGHDESYVVPLCGAQS